MNLQNPLTPVIEGFCVISIVNTETPAVVSAPPTHFFTPVLLWSSSSASSHSNSPNSAYDNSTAEESHVNVAVADDDDKDDDDTELGVSDSGLSRDVKSIVDILSLRSESLGSEMKRKLDQCGIAASSELVVAVLSRVRNDWESLTLYGP